MIDTKIIDIRSFQEEIGLDDDMLKELYDVFSEELSAERESVLYQLEEKKYQEVGRTIHNIKGISSNYKAYEVFEKAKLIDADIKAGNLDTLDKLVQELSHAILKVIDILGQAFTYIAK